jgi:uncharacterized protein
MRSLSVIDWICLIVLIIGGINWGLVGFFDFNLVGSIFGPTVSRVIYALVGICALYVAVVSPNFARKALTRPHRTVPA